MLGKILSFCSVVHQFSFIFKNKFHHIFIFSLGSPDIHAETFQRLLVQQQHNGGSCACSSNTNTEEQPPSTRQTAHLSQGVQHKIRATLCSVSKATAMAAGGVAALFTSASGCIILVTCLLRRKPYLWRRTSNPHEQQDPQHTHTFINVM